MKLVGIELWRVDLALSNPVATSQGSHGPRPVLYVRVVTDEAEGWASAGHCPGAPPSIRPRRRGCGRGGAGGATAVPGRRVTRRELVGRRRWLACSARGRSSASWPPPSRWRSSTLSSARCYRAGRAPRRSARGRRVRRGGRDPARARPRRAGRCGRSAAGWGGTPRALQDRAGMGHRPRSGAAHRLPLGRAAGRRNGAYRRGGTDDDASVLCALDDYGLVCIEQPLPAPDLAALASSPPSSPPPSASTSHSAPCAGWPRRSATAPSRSPASSLEDRWAAGGPPALAMAAEAGIDGFVGGSSRVGSGVRPTRPWRVFAAQACRATSPTGRLSGRGPCGYLEVDGGAVRLTTAPGVGAAPTVRPRPVGGGRPMVPYRS